MPTEGSDEATVAVYCPACAENRFKYFSERLRRSTLGEDL